MFNKKEGGLNWSNEIYMYMYIVHTHNVHAFTCPCVCVSVCVCSPSKPHNRDAGTWQVSPDVAPSQTLCNIRDSMCTHNAHVHVYTHTDNGTCTLVAIYNVHVHVLV